MSAPADALHRLARDLRDDEELASYVQDSPESPALGLLVAAGPGAREAAGEYALFFEAIREGFLLHYGDPRLIVDADPDLRLLAGDYLYALGLERLAERGDVTAVSELGDLISLSAQVQARDGEGADESTGALWLAAAVAVGAGHDDAHERAKRTLREGGPGAARALSAAAAEAADRGGMRAALAGAADSIGFASEYLFDLG